MCVYFMTARTGRTRLYIFAAVIHLRQGLSRFRAAGHKKGNYELFRNYHRFELTREGSTVTLVAQFDLDGKVGDEK